MSAFHPLRTLGWPVSNERADPYKSRSLQRENYPTHAPVGRPFFHLNDTSTARPCGCEFEKPLTINALAVHDDAATTIIFKGIYYKVRTSRLTDRAPKDEQRSSDNPNPEQQLAHVGMMPRIEARTPVSAFHHCGHSDCPSGPNASIHAPTNEVEKGELMAMARRRNALLALIGALMLAPAVSARPSVFPAPDRELMVPVDGGRVYVRVNGISKAGKLPIVLVHGGPGGTHRDLLDALELSNERAVILYDQLDSGRSDQPNDPAKWKIDRFVSELEAIRTALGIEKWHVLGHSWGGTIALEYGARRPASLASLVLASPLISTRIWITDTSALRSKLPAEVQSVLARCESNAPPAKSECEGAMAAFYAAYYRREPKSAAENAYRHPRDHGFNVKLYETMWGSSEFVSTGTLRDYNGERLLDRLDGSRTLLLVGQYDEVRPSTAAAFAERTRGAEFGIVPGAAHGIFSDRPDDTVSMVRAWLARQDLKR